VNVDAEKMLLCKKAGQQIIGGIYLPVQKCSAVHGQIRGAAKAGGSYDADSQAGTLMEDALTNAFPGIRILAIKNIGPLARHKKEVAKAKLIQLARSDEKAPVRAEALKALSKYFKDDDLKTLYREKTNDRSYDVATEALTSLAVLSPQKD
jgi:HEAT repeat protein